MLDTPSFAAVQASRQQMFSGPVPIDGVSRLAEFEVACLKPYQDFVAPLPDAMIRRPTRIPSALAVHNDILDDLARHFRRAQVPDRAETSHETDNQQSHAGLTNEALTQIESASRL